MAAQGQVQSPGQKEAEEWGAKAGLLKGYILNGWVEEAEEDLGEPLCLDLGSQLPWECVATGFPSQGLKFKIALLALRKKLQAENYTR